MWLIIVQVILLVCWYVVPELAHLPAWVVLLPLILWACVWVCIFLAAALATK